MNKELKSQREIEVAMWTVVSREALIAGHKEDGRTVYRREAKAKLIAAALAPGASVARLAREHGLNANLLHVWIRAAKRRSTQTGSKASRAMKVVAGLERAATHRANAMKRARDQGVGADLAVPSPPVKLLPVALAELPTEISNHTPTSEPLDAARFIIEMGGARIVVEGAAIDRAALRVVIDCLRESASK
jgi:transposase-like protein